MESSIRPRRGAIIRTLRKDKWLYLMALPGILFFLVFQYGPMYGIVIAFKHYNLYQGIFASDWAGWDNFQTLFGMSGFRRALRNTIVISLYQLVFVFPAPIILALLINEVRHTLFKKFVQTSVYLPHFVSWVVIGGILYAILSPSTGIVRDIAALFGHEGAVMNIMGDRETFRGLLIVSSIWKEAGFGTVLYLATIATIDPHLYEAATVDGARKWRQLWHVTLPGLRTTIVILLIFHVGSFLNAGLEQVYALYNPVVYEVSEILDTYLYKLAFEEAKYDLATASGLFKSTVGLALVLLTNAVAKKIDRDSGLI
ncbi:sugar ABC transporter permease [Paenibacillus sp. IB182496]|uniref:Sugar ABC transporter permease n=1 Tax=Paenibacillus sabuli TaxID=2772509 RepID=A0A927BSH3_9BACL|nr:ABC transporter permease subunit [Paenibacillus sabuli]MBD2845953.1 sugar ABC transporter permease [Paenibacillus sabuli]